MINKIKGPEITSIFIIVVLLSSFTISYGASISKHNFNEEKEDVLSTDIIKVGPINKYSSSSVTVDDYDYDLCAGIKIYNLANDEMPLSDLRGVIKVKLFVSGKGCVRKINALKFAD